MVSVIFSVRSRPECLHYCIRGALWQTAADYEVIVVNYGNEPAKAPSSVRLINWQTDEEWNNPRASNIGAANANGEWFVFLNCDIIMAPRLLEKSVAILQREPASHVYWDRFDLSLSGTAKVRRLMQQDMLRRWFDSDQSDLGCIQQSHTHGDFLALHRDVYLKAGGYDERMSGYGAYDSDMVYRLTAAGYTEQWGPGFHLLHQYHPALAQERLDRNRRLYQASKRAGGLIRQGGAKHFEKYKRVAI